MIADDVGRRRYLQPATGQDRREELIGPAFQEWHSSGRNPAHSGLVNVKEGHLKSCLCEGDPQGKADVPAAADYAHSRFHLQESFPHVRFGRFGTVYFHA